MVVMNGGPSHLDLFDPKPTAGSHVRGPLRAISTSIPGVQLSECLPRLAERSDRISLIRSLHHEAAPTHEAGHQLLNSGRLASGGVNPPSLGAAAARLLGPRGKSPAHVLLPRPIAETGIRQNCGDGSGWLPDEFHPVTFDPDTTEQGTLLSSTFADEPITVRDRFGESEFGRRLWAAARLIEQGVRVVTVNLCDRLHGRVTWDAHAHATAAPATPFDYRDTLGPRFDRALSGLLDRFEESGLLDETLVICTGEFGRTPRLNHDGGRDHWPHCFSALIAGADIPCGFVVGRSDANGEYPAENPVELSKLVATAYHTLRIDPRTSVAVDGVERMLLDADPIPDLVARRDTADA